MTFRIALDDARLLGGVCRRQMGWDGRARARVLTTQKALGVYTAPPMGVLAFIAIPAEPLGSEPSIDITVSLASLVKELESVAADGQPLDQANLDAVMVPIVPGLTVADLPPAHGWGKSTFGAAAEANELAVEANEEFASRAEGLSEDERTRIADEIWDRPTWGGLTMRALHSAQRLGILAAEPGPIAAAANGDWHRLTTTRGQVFTRSSARPPLSLL